MAPLIIGRPDQKGSTGRNNRMFVEGVLWIVRTGSPWRDLPEAFGDWNSVFRRFSRLSVKGVWWRIFETMSDDPDFEFDSTIVRAHQHAARAKKGGLKIRPIGRSRGGLSTKIHMAVRGLDVRSGSCLPQVKGRCTASRGLDRGISCRGRHGRYGL